MMDWTKNNRRVKAYDQGVVKCSRMSYENVRWVHVTRHRTEVRGSDVHNITFVRACVLIGMYKTRDVE